MNALFVRPESRLKQPNDDKIAFTGETNQPATDEDDQLRSIQLI